MTTVSQIEWTEQTWNPTVGCTKISPGCKHCYAETMARRLQAMGVRDYANAFRLTLLEHRLAEPLRRTKPTVYFVNSMSDLFHQSVPDEYIDRALTTMKAAPQHTFQLLTKRAERLQKFFAQRNAPANLWLGVSVENRRHGVPRIELLQQTPASVRFLSIEPLLEDVGDLDLAGIHWVIVGGESGRKARPMRPEWVGGVQRQCEEQGVRFFFKQWGRWGADGRSRSKKANGRTFAGRQWDDMPETVGAASLTP
jgi:protein gp37